MRAAVVLPATLATYLAAEFVLFHAGFYQLIAEPNSSNGLVQTFLHNERKRRLEGPHQVLAVGDSRMGFFPKYANELQPPTGHTFATISLGGSTPRVWYYMLRRIDPRVDRYEAIIIPVEDYEDADKWGDEADRLTDLNYLAGLTGWRDVFELAASFHDPDRRYRAIRATLVKGTPFQADFHDFLVHPGDRIQRTTAARKRDSAPDFYNYRGPDKGLEDYRIDWQSRTLVPPPGADPAVIDRFENRFLRERPPENGKFSAYLHRWFGRIYDRYRGTHTKLILIRLPRGPWVRPDQPAGNPRSSVREMARQPGVILAPEHEFDFLERPELFMDELHLNGPGQEAFSKALGRMVQRVLAAPGASH
jgi:hypothetical protein